MQSVHARISTVLHAVIHSFYNNQSRDVAIMPGFQDLKEGMIHRDQLGSFGKALLKRNVRSDEQAV